MPVGNKGLEPIPCDRNTNRENAHGDLGDYLFGRGVDHSNVIGESRGEKKGVGKAEDAKAKAKIINSKGKRYVFIPKASIRQSTAEICQA